MVNVLLASLVVILVVVAIMCLTIPKRDGYSDIHPGEPAACRWIAQEMEEDGASFQLIHNMRDTCTNYHALCGNASGGAEVLSIYDSLGNNWEAALDVHAQDMDVVGKDRNECMAPLKCKPHTTKCPPFLHCRSGTCQ